MTKYSKDGFAEYANDEDEDEETDVACGSMRNGSSSSVCYSSDSLSIVSSVFSLNGRPFSAVCRQLLPQYFDEAEENFDEFGFRKTLMDDCDDPTRCATPMETSQQRIKWLALIQFTHEHILQDDMLWRDVEIDRIREAAKFAELLRTEGIPHSLRPFLWPRLCGATAKSKAHIKCNYAEITRRADAAFEQMALVEPQIDKDLLRTMPTNYCFARGERAGTIILRRVLRAVAFMYPDLGYCQGMGVVVAALLLVCSEADTFWIMSELVENILPANYYSSLLLGVRADERIVKHLMQIHMPELAELVEKSELNMSMITINWLITLFSSVLPTRVLYRIWDLIFVYGSVIIFRVIISILKMNEEAILEKASQSRHLLMSDLFALIQQIPYSLASVDYLLEVMQSFEYSITDHLITELRKKHQAILLADNGIICDANVNLPKQKVNRRRLSTGSKNIFQQFLYQSDENAYDEDDKNDPRTKNIRQTEMVIDLRNAILQICDYFAQCRAEMHAVPVITQVDYTPESDAQDSERFVKARREGRKRARALLDFEQQDADELGFQRGQLITIVSERDEHCWVGELDGQQGWFPAKFVEVVDERGKNYCQLGDEAVNSRIVELTRGTLALAFRRILFHGIRRSGRMSTFISHPWPFIEALASSLVEKQRDARSRLTLCDTFKLDQDGKMLSAEELLLRAVDSINASHNAASASLDMKLRSLIVVALNEQCLHLWFDILCNSTDRNAVRVRYYHLWSFIRSPVAHQIKCELRLLSQFAFNLNVESELTTAWRQKNVAASSSFFNGFRGSPASNSGLSSNMSGVAADARQYSNANAATVAQLKSLTQKQPLKEGVRDMLIKHHLFSWDL